MLAERSPSSFFQQSTDLDEDAGPVVVARIALEPLVVISSSGAG
jgi:hypothetical protein